MTILEFSRVSVLRGVQNVFSHSEILRETKEGVVPEPKPEIEIGETGEEVRREGVERRG